MTLSPPTRCPPAGLTIPVTYERARDGDTIEVRIRGSAFVWAVRLLDCWVPELRTEVGQQARDFVVDVLHRLDPIDLRLFIPAPETSNVLRDVFSFDRVLGYLYVSSSTTLNQMLVQRGLASSRKGGELGE